MTEISTIILIATLVGIIILYIVGIIIYELLRRKKKKKYQHKMEIRDLKLEEFERELHRLKSED